MKIDGHVSYSPQGAEKRMVDTREKDDLPSNKTNVPVGFAKEIEFLAKQVYQCNMCRSMWYIKKNMYF